MESPIYRVICEKTNGKGPFDPYLKVERRSFEIPADSEQHARNQFLEAVELGEKNVKGFTFVQAVLIP